MTVTTETTGTIGTVAANWRFGAYPYGLEPLYLPDPGDTGARYRLGAAAPAVRGATAKEGLGEVAPPREQAPDLELIDDVFWFRWIVGHQVTFLLWHLMARALRRMTPHRVADSAMVEALAGLADGCNAMMLYTSSCTREAYERFIRPAMYRQHHSFSGSWAPDYRPVRTLFHGREPQWTREQEVRKLREAIAVNRMVHGAVAAWLVPGSESLLQGSTADPHIQDRGTLGVIYDQFFLTVRGAVSDDRVLDQLLRRLRAILMDVNENGLYPGGGPRLADVPVDCRTPFIEECERRMPGIAAGVAVLSAGLA